MIHMILSLTLPPAVWSGLFAGLLTGLLILLLTLLRQ